MSVGFRGEIEWRCGVFKRGFAGWGGVVWGVWFVVGYLD